MPLKLFLDATINASQVFVISVYIILHGFCVEYILRKVINYTITAKDYYFSSAVVFTFNSPV